MSVIQRACDDVYSSFASSAFASASTVERKVRSSVAKYRAWETEVFAGTAFEGTKLPINVNEYAFNYHTSVPGQMIQWISALEDKKVYGDIAYWNIDGNLSDSAVQSNRGNGQWWLLNAYAGLALIYLLVPIFVIIVFSFNNPRGRFNFIWQEFSLDAWKHPFAVPGVQDALITILSEKTLPIPELGQEAQALRGFNVIATANDRDKGINELSSALRRRFNTVVMPLPDSEDDEVNIVTTRVADLSSSLELPEVPAAVDEIRRVVTVFRELRSGVTADGRTKIKSPSGSLSTAEAISVDVCSNCHPAYTGRERTVASGDRVERFNRRRVLAAA
jgi:ribosomal protein L31